MLETMFQEDKESVYVVISILIENMSYMLNVYVISHVMFLIDSLCLNVKDLLSHLIKIP